MQNKLQIGYIMRHAMHTPNDKTFFIKYVKGVKIRPKPVGVEVPKTNTNRSKIGYKIWHT